MLYDFHHKQNSRKPGSVHATYLVSGTKRSFSANGTASQETNDEDSIMQSSPPIPSSSMPHHDEDEEEVIAVKTMMLVKEESLITAREQFSTITGMHIYSLQAVSPQDIHILTDCNRQVAIQYASEDPLKEWKTYGTIQNIAVRRRTGKRPPPPPVAPAPKPETVKAKAAVSAVSKSSTAEANSAVEGKPFGKNVATEQSNSMTTKPAATKKQESGIFKAFAKGAAAPKLKKSDSEQSSAVPSPALKAAAVPEDVPMTGFSDDDLDDDEDGLGSGLPDVSEDVKEPSGKSKKDRQAELQAMMDQEDEAMDDVDTPGAAAEDEEHDEGALDKTDSVAKDEPKETVTVENGRRRGRRRVMKKKTVKDEEGYLVTKEEAAWESFSEEEPAAKKAKIQVASTSKPAAAGKKAGKPGQGSIMNFFGKPKK